MGMQLYVSIAVFAFLFADICWPCALPFWWSEQFHFPPYYPTGQPKSTYKYRETLHRSDPNNYVHIREYSEYTWWEHDTTRNNVPNNDYPQYNTNNYVPYNPQNVNTARNDFGNVFFSNDGRFLGFYPQNQNGVRVHGNTNNIVPRGDSDSFPSLDTNNIVPSGKINRKSSTSNLVPPLTTVRSFQSTTTRSVPSTTARSVRSTTARSVTSATARSVPSTTARSTESTTARTRPSTTPRARSSTTPRTRPSTTARTRFSTRENVTTEREINPNEAETNPMLERLEENELETGSESKTSLKKQNRGSFLGGWFGTKNPNDTEPCKVSESDIHSLRGMIEKMFSLPREDELNPESKEKAREDIMNKFRELGLQVWTQNFTTPPVKHENGTEESKEGVNLIGVIPGSLRGHLDDEIVLVGAHYDTVADSNGVDDNGSGLAVMLEVAKAITEARCRLNHTLMFVAFDHEENGAMGSNYFVDHYLIPEELKRARGKFQGAFILDGILNYNDVPNTQELPSDYTETLPGLQYFVNNTGNRGNFLAMISRNEMDKHLSHQLMAAWQDLGDHQYKLFNLAVDMGNDIPPANIIERHLNFLRSDHATFWYHNSTSHFPESLNAVLLTDTGPFRGQMKECYHSKCDDLTVISPEKLQFAKKTADALTATLVELTRATALGIQVQPWPLLYVCHILIVYRMMKFLIL